MKNTLTINDLYQDILKLSCSTKNSKIEDELYKFAQEYADQTFNWLKSKNFQKKDIDPNVVKVLNTLIRLKENIAEPSSAEIAKYLINHKNLLGQVPYLKAFQSILFSRRSGSRILEPFQEILNGIKQFEIKGNANSSLIEEELGKIDNQYNSYLNRTLNLDEKVKEPKKRKTKKQSQIVYLKYIAKNFTVEQSSLALMEGYEDLSRYIAGGGIINPEKLMSFSNSQFDLRPSVQKLSDYAKDCLKRVNSVSNVILYEEIKNRLNYLSNNIQSEEYHAKMKSQDDEMFRNILDLEDEDGETENENIEEEEEVSYSNFNFTTLFFISIFLRETFNYLK